MRLFVMTDSEPYINAEDVDWDLFDDRVLPNGLTAREHARTVGLGFAIVQGKLTQRLVDGLLVTYGRPSLVSNKRGTKAIDIGPATAAVEGLAQAERALDEALVVHAHAIAVAGDRLAEATAARDEARANRNEVIREVYRQGATGHALAREVGLSVPRVNQIVAGARL